MFLQNWTDSSNYKEIWYIGGEKYKILNESLSQICPPSEISRFPSDLKHISNWKASEFRSFLLYYAAPTLKGVLPDIYYQHFMLLVFSTTIFLKESATDSDFKAASTAMKRFVFLTEVLYLPKFMTYNLHLLLHVPEFVQLWGQLWDTSCFMYEFYNGILLNLFHGTQHVPQQIVKNYRRIQTLNILFEEHFNNGNVLLGKAAEKLYVSLCQKYRIVGGDYRKEILTPLGMGHLKELTVQEKFAVENFFNCPISGNVFSTFERCTVQKSIVTATSYTRARRNNSVVRLIDSSLLQVEKLICFGDVHLIIGTELAATDDGAIRYSQFIKNTSIMPFAVAKTRRKKAVTGSMIKNKCVLLSFGHDVTKFYIADIVNKFERD